MKEKSFKEWQEEVVILIRKKQQRPFANYKKSRWKVNGCTFKAMYREHMTPQQAANLWGLSHEK